MDRFRLRQKPMPPSPSSQTVSHRLPLSLHPQSQRSQCPRSVTVSHRHRPLPWFRFPKSATPNHKRHPQLRLLHSELPRPILVSPQQTVALPWWLVKAKALSPLPSPMASSRTVKDVQATLPPTSNSSLMPRPRLAPSTPLASRLAVTVHWPSVARMSSISASAATSTISMIDSGRHSARPSPLIFSSYRLAPEDLLGYRRFAISASRARGMALMLVRLGN